MNLKNTIRVLFLMVLIFVMIGCGNETSSTNDLTESVAKFTKDRDLVSDLSERRSFSPSVLLEEGMIESIKEDAENGSIERWSIYDNSPTGATVENVYDEERKSNVIQFKGSGLKNGFKIGSWKESESKSIKWSMKVSGDYTIYVQISTPKGNRYIYYTPNDTDYGVIKYAYPQYIHHGLGESSSDGTWQTFSRDLSHDLKEFEPDNSITSIDNFLIRATGSFDDIVLLKKKKEGTAVVCKPIKGNDYTKQICKKDNMTIRIYDDKCKNEKCTRWNDVRNETIVEWILTAQGEFKSNYNLTEHNNALDINITDISGVEYGLYYNHANNLKNYTTDTIELNRIKSDYTNKDWEKAIQHEYFHHYQFYNTANHIDSFENTSNGTKRYTAWFMEGSADYISNQQITKKPPMILESGLVNDTEKFYTDLKNGRNGKDDYYEWADNPYTRSYFFEMLSHKCTNNFDKKFFKKFFEEIKKKKIKGVIIDGDKSGINTFKEVLQDKGENLACDFGDQLGANKSSSFESALLFYQYATTYKNSMKLLTGEENTNINFVSAERAKSSNFSSNSIDLTKKSINGVGIPAYGAYSIILDKDIFMDKKVVLKVTTKRNNPLLVSIVRSGNRDDSNTESTFSLTRFNGQPHISYNTDEYKNGVTLSEPEEYFITLLNSTDEPIEIEKFSLTLEAKSNLEIFNDVARKYIEAKSTTHNTYIPKDFTKEDIKLGDLTNNGTDEWIIEYTLTKEDGSDAQKYMAVFVQTKSGFEFLADIEIGNVDTLDGIVGNKIVISGKEYTLIQDSDGLWQLTIIKNFKTISGVVRNDNNENISNIHIKFEYLLNGEEKFVETITDDEGSYTLKVDETVFKGNVDTSFLIYAYSEGYVPDSKVIKVIAENYYTIDFLVNLIKENEIVLEIEPQVHHLGDNSFTGSVNSQFQKKSEGLEFMKLFDIDSNKYENYTGAVLKFQAKGIQTHKDKFILNNHIDFLNDSPSDGGYATYKIDLNKSDYQEGQNKITITSGYSTDYDDFEFSNIIMVFKEKSEEKLIPNKIVGKWKGTYTCSQGLTGTTINIKKSPMDKVEAIVQTYAVPSNPNLPYTRAKAKGKYSMPNELYLEGYEWIDRPAGWVLGEMQGTFNASFTTYEGNLPIAGCTTFSLSKVKNEKRTLKVENLENSQEIIDKSFLH